MNFDLSEEQRAFTDALDDFLKTEVDVKRALAAFDAAATVDLGPWQGLMKLGVGATVVPEAYGGTGLELLDLALAAEAVGRHAMPGPFIEHAVATYAIVLAGSEEQKARWLPALASGEKRATIAWAEAGEIWMPGDWKIPASNRITGEKRFVPHAEGADLFVVGLAGGTLALVEHDAAGVQHKALRVLDGGRRLYNTTFSATPAEALPGPAATTERIADAAIALVAADAFGGASRCLHMANDYAKQRVQFGVPIGQFQAVKHQLADMAQEVEPGIGLYWYAAHAFDHEREHASRAISLAKAHLSDVYVKTARRAIELHGGIGYTWEGAVHIWLKRATFDRTFMGRPEIHRARVASLSGW